MSTWQLKSFGDSDALAEACALDFLSWATSSPTTKCVALSGGRIAKDFFCSVAQLAKARQLSLSHIHFFWADERCVPPDHGESNHRVAAELLLTPLDLPQANIHRLRGEDEPERAAQEAEAELRRFAPANRSGQPELDLVLLGMGEDGHVASLFPGETEGTMSSIAVYRAVTASKPPPRRITLGYATIAAARSVWVLASGVGKEAALQESLSPAGMTPLAKVLRRQNPTTLFTDLQG